MNPNYNYRGIPTETFRLASTDTAQKFSESQHSKNNKPAIFATISCETNDIRYCLGGATPTQGAAGLGHILAADHETMPSIIVLANPALIQTFSFISHTEQSAGAIQVTMEYEIGTDLT